MDTEQIADRIAANMLRNGSRRWGAEASVNQCAKDREQLFNRVEQLEDVLRKLVKLKEHKDAHGKTSHYVNEQPNAWEEARKVLDE